MERRNCPKCNGTMEFRLGELECMDCGQRMPVHEHEPQPDEPQRDDGIRRARLIRKEDVTNVAPPPGSPGSILGSDVYELPQAGYSEDADDKTPLGREKNLFLRIVMGVWALTMLLSLPSCFGQSLGGGLDFFGNFWAGAFDLIIIYMVLKSDLLWAKWCCLGNILLGLLVMVGFLFSISALTSLNVASLGFTSLFGQIGTVLNIWLATILWRDIQRFNEMEGH